MKKTMFYNIAISVLLLALPILSTGQTSIGINTDKPNKNAVIEMVSPGNNQGILIPQLTTAQRTNASFVNTLKGKTENNGLLVYDKELNTFFYWENIDWQALLSKDLSRVVKAGNSTGGLTITGLSYPVLSVDAANKGYVDDTVSRVILQIENIENIVNQHTTQINQLTDSIFVYSQYFNEYWDSIVNYSEHFNTIFDSIKIYNEHFTTLFDSVYSYNEHFTTLYDSIYSYSEHFTTLFDSIKVYNEHFTTIRDSITRIQQIFEKAEFKLPQGEIYIGASTGLAKTVPVTGDVLLDGNGVMSIQTSAVTNGMLDKNNIPLSGFGSPITDIGMNNFKLSQLAAPTDDLDAVNKAYSDLADSALSKRITGNKESIAMSEGKIITLRDSVKSNITNIGTLRDSVKTNISDIALNSSRIKELSDTAIAQIAINKSQAKNLRDSINYVYKTGKISLANYDILMGGADDTARRINFATNHFTVSDKIYIADGAVAPMNIAGIPSNGTAGEILVSKGDGTFEWQGKFSGGMSDDLQNGYFWIGNASNKAASVSKTAIALSGFGAASAHVDMGGFKLTNVLNPSAAQDAATKKYVDDSLAVHNTKIVANAADIAGINTKLNSTGLTAGAVPYWNNTALEDSKIWSNGSRIFIGASKPATFNYDCEINGSFKTQKIYHASDERWKKDIAPLDSALAKVLMMNGVQYNWRREEFPGKNFPTGVQIGLIAQQIEKIAPELVTTDNDGYKAVEYANMVAFLIEAMKEQQKIIDAQQKELNLNAAKNAEFEKRLQALEKSKK